ncbi:MAG: uracil-DNA glycosylase [Planctomycetota bacterium]|nr:uracil-DNA glycosylase [Planctomycetota bacterium]
MSHSESESESEATSEALDPWQIKNEASALAQHLHQAGVQWLPKPDPQSITKWSHMFGDAHGPVERKAVAESSQTTEQHLTQRGDLPNHQRRQSDVTQGVGVNPGPDTLEPGSSNRGSRDLKRRLPPTLEIIDGPYPRQSLSDEARKAGLVQLESEVQQCHNCPQLAEKRNHTVFGEGSVRPRVVFFGEAPGADEDRTGRPFVGAAGGLLTKMIEACKFVREDVYILNTIKCRPPNNRNPELAEREQCRGFYRQQLNLLQPEYIVCLGAVAAQELLQTKMSVGSLRGQFHQYHTSKVLVTYHPAYLLREPTRKRAAWQDLQMMLRDAKIEF